MALDEVPGSFVVVPDASSLSVTSTAVVDESSVERVFSGMVDELWSTVVSETNNKCVGYRFIIWTLRTTIILRIHTDTQVNFCIINILFKTQFKF